MAGAHGVVSFSATCKQIRTLTIGRLEQIQEERLTRLKGKLKCDDIVALFQTKHAHDLSETNLDQLDARMIAKLLVNDLTAHDVELMSIRCD